MVCWWIACEQVAEVTRLEHDGIPVAMKQFCVHKSGLLDHVHSREHSVWYWGWGTMGWLSPRGSKGLLGRLLDYT